jgi:serine protease
MAGLSAKAHNELGEKLAQFFRQALKNSPDKPPRFTEAPQRVVMKLHDHFALPYRRTAFSQIVKQNAGRAGVMQEPGLFKEIALDPLFTSQKAEVIRQLETRARKMDPTYRVPSLLRYFTVTIPLGLASELMAKWLSEFDSIVTAYVEPHPCAPPTPPDPGGDVLAPSQGYLNSAPEGIDARYAWDQTGVDGTGQVLVDVEQGWGLNHLDLPHGIEVISGQNKKFFSHGTSVLGIIRAIDSVGPAGGGFCLGIAPQATVHVAGQWRPQGYSTTAPILDALASNKLQFGHVLLLEAQANMWGKTMVPVEADPAVWDVIRLATALGIVVVEAAGNGGEALNYLSNPVAGRVFNRQDSAFKDSGAILVGAASSTPPHQKKGSSCHGNRVDCYAWGEKVVTLNTNWNGTDDNLVQMDFNGTSSASAIVAGAALILQGIAEKQLGQRLSPWQVRAILSNPANGTPLSSNVTNVIGVMPNLKAVLVNNALNLLPDVYLRDFYGDPGLAHDAAAVNCPDVLVRQLEEIDPDTALSPDSATAGEIAEGQDNRLYLRVRNKGATVPGTVTATLYWAALSADNWPDMATREKIGELNLASVTSSDDPTISPALLWPAANIPTPGLYALVVVISHPNDPMPALETLPAAQLQGVNLKTFIRNNNNVSYRIITVA